VPARGSRQRVTREVYRLMTPITDKMKTPGVARPIGSDSIRISVIVPAFNRAYCLAGAIDSVLAQTVPVHEIIVVDDGSTDGTREFVARYQGRVRYHWQENRGLSAARNVGIAMATGSWLAFLDSDDWWHPDKIRLQLDALERNPEAALVYADYWQCYSDGRRVRSQLPTPEFLWPRLRYTNPLAAGSTMLVKKSAVVEVGAFDESLRAAEDWDILVRLRMRLPFAHVAEPLSYIAISDTSLSSDPGVMLSNCEKVLAKTLVQDLSGWQRISWKHRIRAVQLFHAGMCARVSAPSRELAYLLRAVLEWPIPTFYPRRWKALAVCLLRRARSVAP
jgi:glycosyltransferase involved in cell wall biosynthesis